MSQASPARPLAVTMGDPAGVGPELIVKADRTTPFFAIADPGVLERAARRAGRALRIKQIAKADEATGQGDAIEVLPEPLSAEETPGSPDARNAPAIVRAIERGVAACLSGAASGLVTAPIAKAALYEAGFAHPGHTEFIGDLTAATPWDGVRGPVMMLAAADLRVALATVHVPLAEASRGLTTARIVEVGRVLADALKRDFAIPAPRIALAGLNPHAGESGAIGREEIDIINPAAAILRAEGVAVSDARPADTLFHAEARRAYDAVIAMYHDQGLIPIKTLDFWGGVNITLGLPIVRVSPDHGAAFDIAGKGVARVDSFNAALQAATTMARRRA